MANGDGTITDDLTGLAWASAAGTPTVGTCTGGTQDWQEALDYVACLNTNVYLGHADWRLPNVNELQSLNHAGDSSGTWLSSQGFSNVQTFYWSSDSHIGNPDYAWAVNILLGMPAPDKGIPLYYVWPVR